ncbi:MAG: GMC family oxidoreductase [Bermanella sp.]
MPIPLADTQLDTLIVGSGPAGATLAHELSKRGKKVAILEWGKHEPIKGTFSQMAKMAAIPGKGAFINSDFSLLLRGITSGGSSTINFATALAPPLDYFKEVGIDLTQEIEDVKKLVPLETLPDSLMGPMAHTISNAATALGLNWQKLEKFIHMDQCRSRCHRCSYGCPYDAKWSARHPLEAALKLGARLITQAKVSRVLTEHGKAVAVEYSQAGQTKTIYARQVVLSAGGLGSPRILQNSKIKGANFEKAGKDYFVDPVIAVMGSIKGMKSGREVPMAAGLHLPDEGIMLSDLTLPRPLFQAFSAQVGRFDRLLSHQSTLTIMVKIKDELGGKVGPNWLNKTLSQADKQKLEKGCKIAEDILKQAGASHIFRSHHFAAHPGGTAKIGEVVNADLQTQVEGLYVCDASVIPKAWGLPPSYTLICLGLRLAKHLAAKTNLNASVS